MFKRCLTVLLLFIVMVHAFAATPRTTWSGGKKYMLLNDVAKMYGMTVSYSGKTVSMASKTSRLVFDTVKREGSINGVKVTWMEPVLVKNGVLYLSDLDYRLLLTPVLHPKSIPRKRVQTVMIDAGHGGKDKGAPGSNKRWEKEVNLQLALALRKELTARGFVVILTRSGDSFPTLEDRVKIYKQSKRRPDIFISIHCNASTNKSVSGVETFAVTPVGAASSADKKASGEKFPGNAFDVYNARLAYEMQKSLIKAGTGVADRGVKHARFYVIKNVSCPAILIETGFISNARDCKMLFSKTDQQKIVQGMLKGILNYAAAIK